MLAKKFFLDYLTSLFFKLKITHHLQLVRKIIYLRLVHLRCYSIQNSQNGKCNWKHSNRTTQFRCIFWLLNEKLQNVLANFSYLLWKSSGFMLMSNFDIIHPMVSSLYGMQYLHIPVSKWEKCRERKMKEKINFINHRQKLRKPLSNHLSICFSLSDLIPLTSLLLIKLFPEETLYFWDMWGQNVIKLTLLPGWLRMKLCSRGCWLFFLVKTCWLQWTWQKKLVKKSKDKSEILIQRSMIVNIYS